ncbi:hypothetical protein LCGC14_2968990 [marine sediment metagenome]|uniref:Uncharacterized protein n=1 Tax=marine sediment metagenome TaxID=412755 RepID=A0A0F8XA08_9ZZZZ
MNTLTDMFDKDFIKYLEKREIKIRDSGYFEMSRDYKEAIRRLKIFNDASIYSEKIR